MSNNMLSNSELFSKGFGFSPKMVMTDTKLTVEAKAIYGYLSSFSGSGMSSYPSTDTMLYHLNMSKNRYLKHRKLLEDRGYITIQRKKIDNLLSKNVYILNQEPSKSSRCIQNRAIENKELENRELENEPPNSNSIKSNSINNNNTNIVQNESATDSLQVRFDELWKLYPIKKGKALAFKSYKRDIKKKDVTDSLIEKGILKYISNCKKENTDKKYMKHGGTFFSQQVYLDDYEADGSMQEVESSNKPKPVVIPADWIN